MPLADEPLKPGGLAGLAAGLWRLFARGPFGLRRCAVCASPCAATPGASALDRQAAHVPAARLPLCPDCADGLAACVRPCCPLCGREGGAGQGWACVACARAVPAWDDLIFFGLHDGLLRELVLGLKYAARLDRTALLSSCLVQAVRRRGLCPDPAQTVVVPMPLWRTRLAVRGFNQSLELAGGLAKSFGLPLAVHGLSRLKPTVQQARLSFEERQENVAGAFAATAGVAGKRVWLVDDVLTSGATAASACSALREGGASEVVVIVVSRTPKGLLAGQEKSAGFPSERA